MFSPQSQQLKGTAPAIIATETNNTVPDFEARAALFAHYREIAKRAADCYSKRHIREAGETLHHAVGIAQDALSGTVTPYRVEAYMESLSDMAELIEDMLSPTKSE